MKSKSLLSLSELKNPILQFRFVLSKTTLKLQLHVHICSCSPRGVSARPRSGHRSSSFDSADGDFLSHNR